MKVSEVNNRKREWTEKMIREIAALAALIELSKQRQLTDNEKREFYLSRNEMLTRMTLNEHGEGAEDFQRLGNLLKKDIEKFTRADIDQINELFRSVASDKPVVKAQKTYGDFLKENKAILLTLVALPLIVLLILTPALIWVEGFAWGLTGWIIFLVCTLSDWAIVAVTSFVIWKSYYVGRSQEISREFEAKWNQLNEELGSETKEYYMEPKGNDKWLVFSAYSLYNVVYVNTVMKTKQVMNDAGGEVRAVIEDESTAQKPAKTFAQKIKEKVSYITLREKAITYDRFATLFPLYLQKSKRDIAGAKNAEVKKGEKYWFYLFQEYCYDIVQPVKKIRSIAKALPSAQRLALAAANEQAEQPVKKTAGRPRKVAGTSSGSKPKNVVSVASRQRSTAKRTTAPKNDYVAQEKDDYAAQKEEQIFKNYSLYLEEEAAMPSEAQSAAVNEQPKAQPEQPKKEARPAQQPKAQPAAAQQPQSADEHDEHEQRLIREYNQYLAQLAIEENQNI